VAWLSAAINADPALIDLSEGRERRIERL